MTGPGLHEDHRGLGYSPQGCAGVVLPDIGLADVPQRDSEAVVPGLAHDPVQRDPAAAAWVANPARRLCPA
jgi:hypothetical protein